VGSDYPSTTKPGMDYTRGTTEAQKFESARKGYEKGWQPVPSPSARRYGERYSPGRQLVLVHFNYSLLAVKICCCAAHGLHGSAGTVLTHGKWRNSTPRRIKIPSLVEMKL